MGYCATSIGFGVQQTWQATVCGVVRVRHDLATELLPLKFTLEKEMATHSSILAWRIPLAENPGSYSPLDTTEQLSVSFYTELDSKFRDFPGSSDGKEFACNAGDPGSILGSGRTPGEGNGNPLQYSCLEISMDRP